METFSLFMIRHGLAGQHGDYENDDQRPLTAEGQQKTRQIAQRLHNLNLRFDLILTSPLVRAKQTAEILKGANLGKQLEEAAYLAPNGDIQDWLDRLKDWNAVGKSLALVGHEPTLSSWAERLIWGESHSRLVLKKAGVINLLVPTSGSVIGNCQLLWLAPPKLLLD